MPETFEQIADLLVPELQRRGLFKKDYAPGTLRNKLFGRGDAIAAGHPAHAARQTVREAATPDRPANAA
jgi:hypothetical protein